MNEVFVSYAVRWSAVDITKYGTTSGYLQFVKSTRLNAKRSLITEVMTNIKYALNDVKKNNYFGDSLITQMLWGVFFLLQNANVGIFVWIGMNCK